MNFIQVRSFDNYITANMQLSMLREKGIDCYLKDEYTVTIDPLLSPAIGGMKLMVYEYQAERALAIIEETDSEFLQTVPCPNCGKHELELITEIKEPAGFWQKISFLLINGEAREVKKYYHCNSCLKDFTELSDT